MKMIVSGAIKSKLLSVNVLQVAVDAKVEASVEVVLSAIATIPKLKPSLLYVPMMWSSSIVVIVVVVS